MEKNTFFKKIIYVSPNGYLGGAEKFVLTAAEGHLREGSYSPLILFFQDGEAVKMAKAKGIECIVLATSFKLTSFRCFYKALKEVRKILTQYPTGIIHSTMAYSHLVVSLATWDLARKKVWFQHGPVGGTLDKLASQFSVDYMLYNSQYLKALHHHSFPHSKIFQGEKVIPLGVEGGQSRRELFPEKKIFLGSAGRICEGKAFDQIIEALVATKLPFTFKLAGEPKTPHDEKYFHKLKKMVTGLREDQKILFLGHQEAMTSFYQSVDIFIHNSLTPEPFGLVMAEAMANGCLVIGKNEGGAKDFLISEKTGLCFSSQDELVVLLRKVLESHSFEGQKKIARTGQSLIHKNYSTSKMVRELETVYDRLN